MGKKRTRICLWAFVCMMMVHAVTYAADPAMPYVLEKISGVWYDMDGKRAYEIHDGYVDGESIFEMFGVAGGERIYDTFGVAGGAHNFGFIFVTGFGERTREWPAEFLNIRENPDVYHQYMIVHDRVHRRTPEPQYFESIGGIYLGMRERDALSVYGTPTITERDLGETRYSYTQQRLEFVTYSGIVTSITMYAFGHMRFDRSGLSAADSMEDFIKAYHLTNSPAEEGGASIGHQEHIWYSPKEKSIRLGFFRN